MDCIFCEIVKNNIPTSKVWENDNFLAFLDINPVNPGHILIVPKQHFDNFFDIPSPLYEEMFLTIKKLSPVLREAMNSKRIGVIIEGFAVPHAHIHLIPANSGDEMNPTRAKKASAEELAKTQKILSESFSKVF